jgi:hypothetical protein
MVTDTLTDEREIWRVLVQLARALDERDWETVGSVFTMDATGDYSTRPQFGLSGPVFKPQGREQLVAMARTPLGVCGATQHLLGNFTVDFGPEGATSRVYVSALHQGAAAKSHLFYLMAGEYCDKWRRTADGWRICHRQCLVSIHQGSIEVLGLK